MRTIKFRGKAINSGEWIYGMPTYDLQYIFADGHMNSPDNYEVDPSTVGQFTGLLDKDGKEIYEGDIKRVEIEHEDGDDRFYCVCQFMPECCAFVWMDFGEMVTEWKNSDAEYPLTLLYDEQNRYAICGNIHDNPELLTK